VTGPDAYSPFPSNASYWGERFPNASTYDFADGKNGPDLSGRYAGMKPRLPSVCYPLLSYTRLTPTQWT
jgi:hypothetical protein